MRLRREGRRRLDLNATLLEVRHIFPNAAQRGTREGGGGDILGGVGGIVRWVCRSACLHGGVGNGRYESLRVQGMCGGQCPVACSHRLQRTDFAGATLAGNGTMRCPSIWVAYFPRLRCPANSQLRFHPAPRTHTLHTQYDSTPHAALQMLAFYSNETPCLDLVTQARCVLQRVTRI